MVKDKKKKKRSENHALKREKQQKQQEKGDRRKRRLDQRLDDPDDLDDLDELLAQYKLKDQQDGQQIYKETVCPLPSPRRNCTFVPDPTAQNPSNFYMFGGECSIGPTKTYIYNDFFKYSADKNVWRKIDTGLVQPPPRTAHQMVGMKDKLVMFGGEYMSPSQSAFHHWRDTWVFDLKTNKWSCVSTESGPSARSGHRMCAWKGNYILLFGGFYDTYKVTKYFDDLWIFDVTYLTWHKLEKPSNLLDWPEPRSGFQFFGNGDTMGLYGGFCKLAKATIAANNAKDRNSATDANATTSVKGHVYSDMWLLTAIERNGSHYEEQNAKDASLVSTSAILKVPRNETGDDVLFIEIKWEKVIKQSGVTGTPMPIRSGCTMCFNQKTGKAFMFGGIHDDAFVDGVDSDDSDDDSDDSDNDDFGSKSNCLNDSYNFSFEKMKFFKVRPTIKNVVKKETSAEDEEEEVKVLYKDMEIPFARFNSNIVLFQNSFLLFGGGYEANKDSNMDDDDYTFNDLWRYDIKANRWLCISPGLVGQMVCNEYPNDDAEQNQGESLEGSNNVEQNNDDQSNVYDEEDDNDFVHVPSVKLTSQNMFSGLVSDNDDDDDDDDNM